MNAQNYIRLVRRWRWLDSTPLVLLPMPLLQPHHQLDRADREASDFEWRAAGEDPQFLAPGLRRGVRGWHMLEVAMEHDQPTAVVKLYLDSGSGFREEESVHLSLSSGQMGKRVLFLPAPLQGLRVDPMEGGGCFTLIHLRITWLTPWFARDRLVRRLIRLHPDWQGMTKATALRALKQRARELGRHWRDLALDHYGATFERRSVQFSYGDWLKLHPEVSAAEAAQAMESLSHQPLISIVMPVYNPPVDWLRECLESVLAQYYPHWQLCIADDASSDPEVLALLADYAAKDPRIEVIYREHNGHICAASNSALELARGEFVALLDHDDRLSPAALFHVVEALQNRPDAGLLYSDEDKLNASGTRYDPHFKPQWNPDLLLAQNYISHLGVYRTALLRELGGFREGFEGAQDHDLALRVTARLSAEQIVHIPHVLYHWRAGEGSTALDSDQKAYTDQAGLAALRDYLAQQAPDAEVEAGLYPNTFRVRWPLPRPTPLVSLLIPTRDRVEILKPCVDAILARTDYPNFELLILDNQSSCAATLDYMRAVAERDPRVRVLQWDHPFNYSAINNFGARQARGEILGLVNNDIEPINDGWLDEMVRQAARPEIGCVGAKLYYPNDTLQHGGVILGLGGVAGHSHKYFDRDAPGYFARLHLAHNLSAVTAACLLLRRAVFEEVGGLDEQNLPIAFNDVDLCLKVREAGYRNLWTPYAELYHHESVSRGVDDTGAKRARANAEVEYMRRTWGPELDRDPAYNPNLTRAFEDFSLR